MRITRGGSVPAFRARLATLEVQFMRQDHLHDEIMRPRSTGRRLGKFRLCASLVAATLALAACGGGDGGDGGGGGDEAAEGYPDREITFVVPFSAGGPTDTVTRLIAEPM